MVGLTESKKYGGNGALYMKIDRSRQRTFLRRNITQALEQHAQAVRTSQRATNEGTSNCAGGKIWSFPDQATLATLAEKKKAILKIDIRKLVPPRRTNPSDEIVPPRKKARLLTANCRLIFKLYTTRHGQRRNDKKDKEDVIYDSRAAILQAYRNERGEEIFSVDMEKPLFVEHDKFNIFTTHERGYKAAPADTHTIMVYLAFPDPDDMELVVPVLNNNKNVLPGNYGKIYAKWRKLPLCPGKGRALPMFMVSAGDTYDLSYEMEMDIGWHVSKETAMQSYNRALRCVRGLQLPSPISEPETPAKTRFAWMFKDQMRAKAIVLEGFLCLFCNKRDYRSMDRLHHHLRVDHDIFTVKLEEVRDRYSYGFEVIIEIDVSNKYSDHRSSNNVADPREVDWIAPARPFDLKAYLKGDDSWIATGHGLKRKNRQAKPLPLPQGAVRPRKPSEVQDMPRVERRTYRVPKAPGDCRFFRTDSKRPMEEGEHLSESDDGISDDWLKLRRNQATRDAGATMPAKAFMIKWDDYMQDEQLSGDTHAGDAVIRFARKYRSWLNSRDTMGTEFLRKTSELHSDSIICTEVYEACVNLIQGDGSMIDAGPEQNGEHRLTPPAAPEPNGTSALQSNGTYSKPKNPRTKLTYVAGGPGGGGRYIAVAIEDDGKKGKEKARPGAGQENSIDSSLRTPADSDVDVEMADEASHEGEREPHVQEELGWQPSFAVQSGCFCGRIVDNDLVAISCANLVSTTSPRYRMQQTLI